MTTLSKDEILRLAQQCWTDEFIGWSDFGLFERFAHLCRADLVAELETLRYELDAIAGIKQERDVLRIALSHYANKANWDDDFHGTKRKWLEPDSSTRNAYAGFGIAQAAMKRGEA